MITQAASVRFLAFGMMALLPGIAFSGTHLLSPPSGALVGPRPTLTFLVDDFKATLRFSIDISHDHFKKEGRSWDMRKNLANWVIYEEGNDRGATFMIPEDLGEGTWWWRAYIHDGPADSGPDFEGSFQVDATPPAEVEGLKVTFDKQTKATRLHWNPVATDAAGGPETVALYRVYCYDKRGIFPQGQLKLLGTAETETFLDPNGPRSSTISYYRVTAVDSVGNETIPPKSKYEAEKPAPHPKGRKPETAGGKPRPGTPEGPAGPRQPRPQPPSEQ